VRLQAGRLLRVFNYRKIDAELRELFALVAYAHYQGGRSLHQHRAAKINFRNTFGHVPAAKFKILRSC
jgi:hypothetical protein